MRGAVGFTGNSSVGERTCGVGNGLIGGNDVVDDEIVSISNFEI
jgi:hypothetical protein